jgi:predicted secreted protein
MPVLMVLRLLALAALCAVSAAAAIASTSPVITTRDNGKTFTVRTGGTLALRLPERPRWLNPKVTGTAIRLTQVNFFRDPGYRQWSISALTPGTAKISAVRYAVRQTGCDLGPCGPRLFRVTIVVH